MWVWIPFFGMTADWSGTIFPQIFASSGSKVTGILESIIFLSIEHLIWQIVPAGMMMYCFGDLTELKLDSFWDYSKWTNGSITFYEWFGKYLGNICCISFVLYGADKCSMAFVPRKGYCKFSEVTRNGTVTKFWLSLSRKTSIPPIHHKEAFSVYLISLYLISLGSYQYYLEFLLTLWFSNEETFV